MKSLLKPVALDEKSYNVNLLHKTLGAFGLNVAKDETAEGKAGDDTVKNVRTLQERLGVSVDEAVLVDEATVIAIEKSMKERGLTTASRSFTVSGTVRLKAGGLKKRQQLVAYDLDLRSVAVFRTVANIKELKSNGGFEFLGEAISDNFGKYKITFYDWQYSLAERKKADVVVYALDGEEIIGRSEMVNSEKYSDKGLVRNLDVIITAEDKRTEYEALMSALNPFLEESQTTLSDIATSNDQLAFTASELDVDLLRIKIAASAELLRKVDESRLLHELLYGIGRQDISLNWTALYKQHEEYLRKAIVKSVDEKIIREFHDKEITAFLAAIEQFSTKHLLDDKEADKGNSLNAMLQNALPEEKQRFAFVSALRSFNGSDFRDFWSQHLPDQPEFKDKPELTASLLLTQQLTLLTGNHQALVNELKVTKGVTSVHQLFDLEKSDWVAIIQKTGVPDFIKGDNEEERVQKYSETMQAFLNASLPTRRIEKMIEKNDLPIKKTKVVKSIGSFLSQNEQFDFAGSQIHAFSKEIKAVAGEDYEEVRSELMKIQRVFQVSTTPEAMKVLLEAGLHSAYTIASIPRKSFIQSYSGPLGGEMIAFGVHQRASHMNKNSEDAAIHLWEYMHWSVPRGVLGADGRSEILKVIENRLPNYSELFGSPDICECKHCRSVLSPAAYFIDLLRFLWRSGTNSDEKTPLDILTQRRPDLQYLPLTCENSNTLIPYIDLVNEVMEYYVANNSLDEFKGFDTGDATTEELRANPQNFEKQAYSDLKNAKYPFTLPYHQPLDVIRTYSDHLKVSRYEAMKAMNPQPDDRTKKAIEAEALRVSEEIYTILTGETFDGTPDFTDLWEYFGYDSSSKFENMQNEDDADGNPRGVRVLLERTGLTYVELVELVKTMFINPYQKYLDFLQRIAPYVSDPASFYARLEEIEAGTLSSSGRSEITRALEEYNEACGTALTFADFSDWVADHLSEFRQVVTLYEPESRCNLETTKLRTIQSIYENRSTSGITDETWSKMHRFIRLWRTLGWTIHETDLILSALGEENITTETISKLESVLLLSDAAKVPLNQLGVLWGNIDTYGKRSLYGKLFLSKSIQEIEKVFQPDAEGNYLRREHDEDGELITLAKYQSSILAAFRITEEELDAILLQAQVIDEDGTVRNLNIDIDNEILNVPYLSTIYRYVVFSKALKVKIVDLCKLVNMFNASPFSVWDKGREEFVDISPDATYDFFQQANSVKAAGFKPSVLEYILQGTLTADSSLGLDSNKILQTAKAIRDTFEAIEQAHPERPEVPLTSEILTTKLSLTFQPEIVSRFMGIVEGTESFETKTDDNLNIIIPDDSAQDKIEELVADGIFSALNDAAVFLKAFSRKYSYVNASGKLTCTGVISDLERRVLEGLENVNPNFQEAVAELYAAPETFIRDNFNALLEDPDEMKATLLDRPTQETAASLEDKLSYVYVRYLPHLKQKLQKDTITQHIAALIGLSQEATALLIADDLDVIISDLSRQGFSATYFSDAHWTTEVLAREDGSIEFSWEDNAPDTLVPADNFSVRWQAYIAAPASGEYTFMVKVEEADETFRLYLDNTLILEKNSADSNTVWERNADLNAAEMHLLALEYAEVSNNAGVRLYWKKTDNAPSIIPASVAYPAAILDAFTEKAILCYRAAKFILGFGISDTELNHFLNYSEDFDDIDFMALEPRHFERINKYMTLRDGVPQAQAFLSDVFALANRHDSLAEEDDLFETLRLATAWDETNLLFLINEHFELSIDDFKNEIALNRIYKVMKIVSKTGISARIIVEWGAAETDFSVLHETAKFLKNRVKAKYQDEEWLKLAGDLSDKIRENQKQSLISYLLVQQNIHDAGVRNADGLFEYFLIDVQMGACMDTSRIVQASAAIQMFVNRCLLNLESDRSSGSEKGISPSAIDKDRWEWMQNYRVWEANRKIFLFPENWLEPEWRNDRSEFFRDLESYLVQNDITERTVEQGLRNYLTSLNEVANLEVCGMHQEDAEDGELKLLHVFARTNKTPYTYFYRTWNKYRKWSAWEKVQLDIRSVEEEDNENSDNCGVHLIPVVWKQRLFLFWPEFFKKVVSESDSSQCAKEAADIPMSRLEPGEYWEIKLAWSGYVDGKWSPKQVSKKSIYVAIAGKDYLEKDLLFIPVIIPKSQQLVIFLYDANYNDSPYNAYQIGGFVLSDIHSEMEVFYVGISEEEFWKFSTYMARSESFTPFLQYIYEIENKLSARSGQWRYYFSKQRNLSILQYGDKDYLLQKTQHDISLCNNISIKTPFFFSELDRTYFVHSAEASFARIGPIFDMVSPERINPLLNFEATNRYSQSDVSGVGNLTTEPANAKPTISVKNVCKATKVGRAFALPAAKLYGGVVQGTGMSEVYLSQNYESSLEFHTFYHPFSSKFVTRLNQGGIPALMGSDTEDTDDDEAIASDGGRTFEDAYGPNFSYGHVKRHQDFETPPDPRTAYKENVCFDVYGANSLYNWELFFHAPLYIATRLSKNGKFEEAIQWFHYIFDPTTDEDPVPGELETSRYWQVLPFKKEEKAKLEDWFRQNLSPEFKDRIDEWRDNPFDSHRIASNRPLAYMKHVVIKYVENLIAWGDSLFRQFTRESVNEALQIYVIANHILGPRPDFVPKRGEIKAESYVSLEDKWDDFSNALVELENIFPYSSEVSVDSTPTGPNILGIGPALYFCLPANEKLIEKWDTVADRLFKIRHCQDIDGVERKLALFAPPISPEALIQALSKGLSLGSILSDLSSPPPIYRFTYLLQKANEFCSDVKSLGAAILSAMEKRDAEELSRLRALHETCMLELITAIKERQVLDALAHKDSLLKARETAEFRLQHYKDLLGESVTVPAFPTIEDELTAESQLPADTNIEKIETDIDESLVESDERGVKLIPKEKEDLAKSEMAKFLSLSAGAAEALAGILYLFPELSAELTPLGVGAGAWYGGQNLGAATSVLAKAFSTSANFFSQEAALAAKTASYIRREQDWTLQANLAAKEIIQLDKQIASADIRIQVAEKELENHKTQIENAQDVELHLKNKFTSQELYQWMKEQLFSVYKQSYDLAFDMAKKTEKAYKYELGTETASFVQYGYWDSSKEGLLSGEKLQLALRQMEKAYLEENRRELELSKSISLALVNPLALVELRETGKCYVTLPEELFDLDFQGHYFRRIKSVSLSIPCVAGPYTTVNCSLRLLKNSIRMNTDMGEEGYSRMGIDDIRFRKNNVPVSSIATSTGQNDSGMFEFSFQDARYLPFEGAGAISDWMIELSTEKELRQFDYSTISDVILHVKYSARESGGMFKEKAVEYIRDFIINTAEEQPLMRMFSMKHEFPSEWHRFLHPTIEGAEQVLSFTIGKERFPFFTKDRSVDVMKIEVFAKCQRSEDEVGDYHLVLSYMMSEDSTVTSSQITMPQSEVYGGLYKATISGSDSGLNLDDFEVQRAMNLKMKCSSSSDYRGLATNPDEVEDIFLVFYYKLR